MHWIRLNGVPPAVQAYYALVEALREFAEQGGRLRR
jgi:hypothetical protein